LPHLHISSIIGNRDSPFFDREYSTFGKNPTKKCILFYFTFVTIVKTAAGNKNLDARHILKKDMKGTIKWN
jgi:hypothetical protein